jgi:uncharacterized protein DUF6459
MPAQQAFLIRIDELPHDDSSCRDVSAVRLLTVPEVAPPFDGDLPGDDVTMPAPEGYEDACRDGGPRSGEGQDAGRSLGTSRSPGAGPDAGPDPSARPDAGPDAGARPDAGPDAGARPDAGPDAGGDWPERFARLLTEALTGSRPARQLLPWTTERARTHLRKLMPAFNCTQRPRVLRVITTRPTRDAVEMTVIVRLGPRTRALAVRLEAVRLEAVQRTSSGDTCAARWLCTDIEAA